VARLQRHALFVAGGVARLSRYHYNLVGGVAQQSHAMVVARSWAHNTGVAGRTVTPPACLKLGRSSVFHAADMALKRCATKKLTL
jgi:hypothetical protein